MKKDFRFCILRSSMILVVLRPTNVESKRKTMRALRNATSRIGNPVEWLGKTFPIAPIFAIGGQKCWHFWVVAFDRLLREWPWLARVHGPRPSLRLVCCGSRPGPCYGAISFPLKWLVISQGSKSSLHKKSEAMVASLLFESA